MNGEATVLYGLVVMVVKPSAFKGKMNKTLNTKFLNRVH